MRYAEITRDNLITLDPQHKEGYIANTAAYLAKLGVGGLCQILFVYKKKEE